MISWLPGVVVDCHAVVGGKSRSIPCSQARLKPVLRTVTLDERAAGHDLVAMQTFAELVASRKAWLVEVLSPWCRQAALKDLKRAELEWVDIAGKVDPEKTLWYWAWSRFPDLVNADLVAIDEARRLTVTLHDGRTYTGYPDCRRSKQGQLVLVARDPAQPRRNEEHGPFSLDAIAAISGA
jgi:hypothetical protein